LTEGNLFTYNYGNEYYKRDKAKLVVRQGRKATDLNREAILLRLLTGYCRVTFKICVGYTSYIRPDRPSE